MALTTETSTRPSTASQRDICLLHLHLSLRTCVKYDAEVSRTINVLQRCSEAGVTHAAVFTWCKCYMHGGDRHALPACHVARQGIQNQSWWPSPAAQKESQMEKSSFDAVPRRIQDDEMCVFLSHRRVSNSARLVNIRGSRRGPRLPLIA